MLKYRQYILMGNIYEFTEERNLHMPTLTKMSDEEVEALTTKKSGPSERARIRQQYIDYLKEFKPGDWVSVELQEGEKRQTVRNRLLAAAKELGYDLKITRSRGNLRFEIQSAEK
jgi:hypothetical protein